eukprot:4629754-Amphidinium_carterae.1
MVRSSDQPSGPPAQRPRLQHHPWPTPQGWNMLNEEARELQENCGHLCATSENCEQLCATSQNCVQPCAT